MVEVISRPIQSKSRNIRLYVVGRWWGMSPPSAIVVRIESFILSCKFVWLSGQFFWLFDNLYHGNLMVISY